MCIHYITWSPSGNALDGVTNRLLVLGKLRIDHQDAIVADHDANIAANASQHRDLPGHWNQLELGTILRPSRSEGAQTQRSGDENHPFHDGSVTNRQCERQTG